MHRFVARDDDSADNIAVSVDRLCRAVDDDVGAVLEGALQIRTGERIVDDQDGVARVRDFGCAADIGDRHRRVCRRLNKNELGRRRHCRIDALEVGGVYKG